MSKKEKKEILASGVDAAGNSYFYKCPKCGKVNALNNERCEDCNKKRPSDAYESAIVEAPKKEEPAAAMNGYPFGYNPLGPGYYDPFMPNPSLLNMTFPNYGPDAYGAYYGQPIVEPQQEAAPAEEEKPVEAPKKRVSGASIAGLILSIITLAVLIVPHFLTQDFVSYLQIMTDKAGLTLILDTVNNITSGGAIVVKELLLPAGVVLIALFTVLTLLGSLFTIKCRKYPIANRVFAWLAVIGAILMMVALIIVVGTGDLAYGSIIVSALVLITAFVTLGGKRK